MFLVRSGAGACRCEGVHSLSHETGKLMRRRDSTIARRLRRCTQSRAQEKVKRLGDSRRASDSEENRVREEGWKKGGEGRERERREVGIGENGLGVNAEPHFVFQWI